MTSHAYERRTLVQTRRHSWVSTLPLSQMEAKIKWSVTMMKTEQRLVSEEQCFGFQFHHYVNRIRQRSICCLQCWFLWHFHRAIRVQVLRRPHHVVRVSTQALTHTHTHTYTIHTHTLRQMLLLLLPQKVEHRHQQQQRWAVFQCDKFRQMFIYWATFLKGLVAFYKTFL